MAHIEKDGNILVDWTTGDDNGDRAFMFQAYRNFLKEIKNYCHKKEASGLGAEVAVDIEAIFDKWKVSELNVDDFPRITIEYPEDFPDELKGTKLHIR